MENGTLKLKTTSGEFSKIGEFTKDDSTEVEITSKTLFRVRKVAEENVENGLQGAKFKVIDTATNDYAKDVYGNYLGEEENIDGTLVRVITTDEKGWIEKAVFPGIYEVTEVKAPDGYKISKEPSKTLEIKVIKGEKIVSTEEWVAELSTAEDDVIEREILTKDGGRIFVGAFGAMNESGNVTGKGTSLIGKYNKDSQLVWSERIVTDESYGYPRAIIETEDEGLLIAFAQGVVKYKKERQGYVREWESTITQNKTDKEIDYIIETKDGGFVIGLDNQNDIQLIDSQSEILLKKESNNRNVHIVKYKKTENGYEVEWYSSMQNRF